MKMKVTVYIPPRLAAGLEGSPQIVREELAWAAQEIAPALAANVRAEIQAQGLVDRGMLLGSIGHRTALSRATGRGTRIIAFSRDPKAGILNFGGKPKGAKGIAVPVTPAAKALRRSVTSLRSMRDLVLIRTDKGAYLIQKGTGVLFALKRRFRRALFMQKGLKRTRPVARRLVRRAIRRAHKRIFGAGNVSGGEG